MAGRLNAEDMLRIHEVLALYNWHFDAGEGEDWAGLWVDEGEFTLGDRTVRGKPELAAMAVNAFQTNSGSVRHHTTDIIAQYGPEPDIVHAKANVLITQWGDKPGLFGSASSELVFVRRLGEWKLRSNSVEIRRAPSAA